MTDLSNLPAGAKVIRVEQDSNLNKYQTLYQLPNGTLPASSSSGGAQQTVRLVSQVPARQIVLPQRPGQPQQQQQQQQGPRQVMIRQGQCMILPQTTRLPNGQIIVRTQTGQVTQPGQVIVRSQAGQVTQPGQIIVRTQAGQVTQPGQVIVRNQAGQVTQPGQVILRPGQVIVSQQQGQARQAGQVVYQLSSQGRQPGQQVIIRSQGGQNMQPVRLMKPAGQQAQGSQYVLQTTGSNQSGQVIVKQGNQYVIQSSSGQQQSNVQIVAKQPQQPQRAPAPAPAPPESAGCTEIQRKSGQQDEEHGTASPATTVQAAATQGSVPSQEDNAAAEPEVDIDINNVVCSFNTRCHLNLKKIATEGSNVIYKRENGMVNMKLRRPQITASIWSSGKITCTGATSEESSKIAARQVTRILQKMGFRVRFCSFRVVNVLGTCGMPWGIRITHFSNDHRENASYEPELHPGVTYKIKEPKATLKVFSTGSITCTAPCVKNVGTAIEHIYPLVYPYRTERTEPTKRELRKAYEYQAPGKIARPAPIRAPPRPYKRVRLDVSDDDDDDEDSEDYDLLDSDEDEEEFEEGRVY